MSGIKVDLLSKEISKIMQEYKSDVATIMKDEAKEIAKETVAELKQSSPEGRGSKKGHYKDGWGLKVEKETAVSVGISIYNKKKPGLTHLLEKGHVKRTGGRVEGIPHISKAEQNAVEKFEEKLKERLKS